MKPIKSAVFLKSSAFVVDCPPSTHPEYAFIGRSNVGKSSLINLLTNNGKLAKVSSKPGKTRLINHFMIDDAWFLVDLPGYGWAKVSKSEQAQWKKMIENYFIERENLTMVFVLLDSRHEPQKIDLAFIQKLGEDGIPIGLIFTKVDKQGKNQAASNIALYKRVLKTMWEELPPIFITSTVTGAGKDELISYVREVNESL